MTRDAKYISALLLGSMLPALAYVLADWQSYINLRDALSAPESKICPSGDSACAQEILGERWADFMISATLGFGGIYILTLAVAVAVLVAIDQVRFRARTKIVER
jgi:hypothetical protein